jgi:hypothetical protein
VNCTLDLTGNKWFLSHTEDHLLFNLKECCNGTTGTATGNETACVERTEIGRKRLGVEEQSSTFNDDMFASWRPLETTGCIGSYLLEEEGSLLKRSGTGCIELGRSICSLFVIELSAAKRTLRQPRQLPSIPINSFVGMVDGPTVMKGDVEVSIQWGGGMSGCKGR